MTSRVLFVALVIYGHLAAGADSIAKADARDAAIPAGTVLDPAIRWQFDTHG